MNLNVQWSIVSSPSENETRRASCRWLAWPVNVDLDVEAIVWVVRRAAPGISGGNKWEKDRHW
jgi:hypothetical protein